MLTACVLIQDLNQQALVDMLLMCTSHPTPEIAMVPLNFWYTFCRELDRLEPRELKQSKLTAFAPSLTSLIEVLLRLMRYPEDIDQRTDDQVRARAVQVAVGTISSSTVKQVVSMRRALLSHLSQHYAVSMLSSSDASVAVSYCLDTAAVHQAYHYISSSRCVDHATAVVNYEQWC
jgi:hypothetical protein